MYGSSNCFYSCNHCLAKIYLHSLWLWWGSFIVSCALYGYTKNINLKVLISTFLSYKRYILLKPNLRMDVFSSTEDLLDEMSIIPVKRAGLLYHLLYIVTQICTLLNENRPTGTPYTHHRELWSMSCTLTKRGFTFIPVELGTRNYLHAIPRLKEPIAVNCVLFNF